MMTILIVLVVGYLAICAGAFALGYAMAYPGPSLLALLAIVIAVICGTVQVANTRHPVQSDVRFVSVDHVPVHEIPGFCERYPCR